MHLLLLSILSFRFAISTHSFPLSWSHYLPFLPVIASLSSPSLYFLPSFPSFLLHSISPSLPFLIPFLSFLFALTILSFRYLSFVNPLFISVSSSLLPLPLSLFSSFLPSLHTSPLLLSSLSNTYSMCISSHSLNSYSSLVSSPLLSLSFLSWLLLPPFLPPLISPSLCVSPFSLSVLSLPPISLFCLHFFALLFPLLYSFSMFLSLISPSP